MQNDFSELEQTLTEQFTLRDFSIHGPSHWHRVRANGLRMAARNDADEMVVRLFAIFHDSQRKNDGHDPEHGQRAAQVAAQMHGEHFSVSKVQLELLCLACELHHQGGTTDEVTVGTCWDADRLDLTRVGMRPDPEFMSTAEGKFLAVHERFEDERLGQR